MTGAGGVLAMLQSFQAAEIAKRFNDPGLQPMPDSSAARPTMWTSPQGAAAAQQSQPAPGQSQAPLPGQTAAPGTETGARLHQTLATLRPPAADIPVTTLRAGLPPGSVAAPGGTPPAPVPARTTGNAARARPGRHTTGRTGPGPGTGTGGGRRGAGQSRRNRGHRPAPRTGLAAGGRYPAGHTPTPGGPTASPGTTSPAPAAPTPATGTGGQVQSGTTGAPGQPGGTVATPAPPGLAAGPGQGAPGATTAAQQGMTVPGAPLAGSATAGTIATPATTASAAAAPGQAPPGTGTPGASTPGTTQAVATSATATQAMPEAARPEARPQGTLAAGRTDGAPRPAALSRDAATAATTPTMQATAAAGPGLTAPLAGQPVNSPGALVALAAEGAIAAALTPGGQAAQAAAASVIFNAAMIPGWPYPSAMAKGDPAAAASMKEALQTLANAKMTPEEMAEYLAKLGARFGVIRRLRDIVDGIEKDTEEVLGLFAMMGRILGSVLEGLKTSLDLQAVEDALRQAMAEDNGPGGTGQRRGKRQRIGL
ncbi:MAG: hypothetical protein ACE368_16330 [Paracoccaceae bacterium]